jgi:hypothetical protein
MLCSMTLESFVFIRIFVLDLGIYNLFTPTQPTTNTYDIVRIDKFESAKSKVEAVEKLLLQPNLNQ